VGPVWDQLPEGAFDLSPSRMLKPRLARPVGVSGSSGRSGRVGPRAVVGAYPGCLLVRW
jgi:hypothetical protein